MNYHHSFLTALKVTWDEHSLFVRGERIFLYTGEFHPWRLPVVDLWKDVLQKIKALGYNGVSFGTVDFWPNSHGYMLTANSQYVLHDLFHRGSAPNPHAAIPLPAWISKRRMIPLRES